MGRAARRYTPAALVFLHPLGLLALLGVPIVALLHLFRRRFRTEAVSALFLWTDDLTTDLAGRRPERIVQSASFWLELATALCLGLFFAGPKGCTTAPAEHLVVVLDASASMGARSLPPAAGSDAPRTVRDAAVEAVEARLAALPRGSRATVLVTGSPPGVLAGPAAAVDEARERLAAFAPIAVRHDAAPALALALELAGGGAVLFVSDRLDPAGVPREVEVLALGRPAPNVALVHAARERLEEAAAGAPEDGGERLRVGVQAFGAGAATPLSTELLASVDGRELARRPLRLEPGERELLALDLPAGAGTVELRLSSDALSIDDAALLPPPPPRPVTLATTWPPETCRDLGLARGERPLGALAGLAGVVLGEASSAELVLGAPGSLPARAAGAARPWTLELADLGEARADVIGPFLLQRDDPLLDGVVLRGLVWSADPELALAGAPLVLAGELPLLVRVGDARWPAWRLNLDPARSTLARSPDWPILLSNLVELRRAELPGPRSTALVVGAPLVYVAEEEAGYVLQRVDGPAAEARTVAARGTLEVLGLAPGLWSLARSDAPDVELARYGVRFEDPLESDLAGAGAGRRASESALASVERTTNPLATALLAAALALALADFWVLGRRRRPAARPAAPGLRRAFRRATR